MGINPCSNVCADLNARAIWSCGNPICSYLARRHQQRDAYDCGTGQAQLGQSRAVDNPAAYHSAEPDVDIADGNIE